MNTHTHTTAAVVKGKEVSPKSIKWARWHRARRAFIESRLMPYQVRIGLEYMLSKQGKNEHAHPSEAQMAHDLGISQSTVQRWIILMEEHLPKEVFTVTRVGKHKGGRHKNSYKCTDFHNWTDKFVETLEAGMWKNSKPRKPTVIDKQREADAVLAAELEAARADESLESDTPIISVTVTPKIGVTPGFVPSKSVPVMEIGSGGRFNGALEVVRDTENRVENIIERKMVCPICKEAINGPPFRYYDLFLCEQDGSCHQRAHDIMAVPPEEDDWGSADYGEVPF